MRFLCNHSLIGYIKAMVERGHDPSEGQVEVVSFYPSDDGTVVCEVEAPTPQDFQRWLKATACSPPAESIHGNGCKPGLG